MTSLSPLDEHFFMEANAPAARALEHLIAEIAPTEMPVLIVGESGTGKEVVALRVHRLSKRRSEPFHKMICTTIGPEHFDEPLALGTGSKRVQTLFEGGTVFLDEVSELDPACQLKLLHLMPDGDALPHEGCLHARVISATSRNLEEEIRLGRFRRELYYRINGVCVHLPPLRQRKEDIPGLVDFFLARYAAQFARPKPSPSIQGMGILMEYSWPGNIRELEYTVRKIVALGDEQLALADLRSLASGSPAQGGPGERISLKEAARAASRQAERELILGALARTRWNRKRAAKELQISYKALLYKLKQIGLDDSSDPSNPRGAPE